MTAAGDGSFQDNSGVPGAPVETLPPPGPGVAPAAPAAPAAPVEALPPETVSSNPATGAG